MMHTNPTAADPKHADPTPTERRVGAYFARLAVALLALIVGFFAITSLGPPLGRRAWNASFYGGIEPKHAALDAATGSRLIVTGGSSVAIGVHVRALGERFALQPVNLGLSAAFGAPFIVREIADVTRCGDVAVVVLEYDIGDVPTASALGPVYFQSPFGKRYGDVGFVDAVKLRASYFRESLDVRVSSVRRSDVYDRSRFDDVGDFTKPLDSYNRSFDPGTVDTVRTYPWAQLVFKQLRAAVRAMEDKGVRVFVTSSPYPKGLADARRAQFARYWTEATKVFGPERLLLAPDEAAMDDRIFSDTPYHLGGDGRRVYTSRLGDALAQKLAGPAPAPCR